MRESLTAFHEVFRAHSAVTLAGADAQATSAELRDVWRRSWRPGSARSRRAIEAERARGAAPDGVPARELAISLLLMNERVLHTSFARLEPAVEEAEVVDVLVGDLARRHLRHHRAAPRLGARVESAAPSGGHGLGRRAVGELRAGRRRSGAPRTTTAPTAKIAAAHQNAVT